MLMRLLFIFLSVLLLFGCAQDAPPEGPELPPAPEVPPEPECVLDADCYAGYECIGGECVPVSRYDLIPEDAVKMTPETDRSPAVSHIEGWEDPVPLPYPVNTAGGEDSAFIMPDGNTLYFFFTPGTGVPVEEQVADGVTGIYVSHKVDGGWSEPERILLQEPGKLAGDGCEFVQGNTMIFCTVREWYTGIHWFTAEYVDGKWQNWEISDFDPEYEVGELHVSPDGNELYFHSSRAGGKGGLDIWKMEKVDGEWAEPVNVEAVNTERDEGWPALSPDGNELWISHDYGVWRSEKVDGEWTEPERAFFPLAGEASVDGEGNVYFTHHFFDENDTMIEADIYVAYKR